MKKPDGPDIFTFAPPALALLNNSRDSSAHMLARIPPRYAPAISLPPYSYVPGHDLPHPVNDPRGHLYTQAHQAPEPSISPSVLSTLPTEPTSRRHALAATLAADPEWRFALDLFNGGFYWEGRNSQISLAPARGTVVFAVFSRAQAGASMLC